MLSPRIRRLQSDYERLKNRFKNWPLIQISSFEGNPPEKYRIIYNIHGLYTEADGSIKERNQHILEINLGLEYPRRPPQCRLVTPIFHPNFNETEVCAQDNYAASEGLDDLVIRIGQMIAYQFYNTKSPLNGLAAKWAAKNNEKLPVDAREISPPQGKTESSPLALQPQVVRIASADCEKSANQAVNQNSVYNKNRIQNAINLIRSEKYDEAMAICIDILEDAKYIKDVYYYRAIINTKNGDNSAAISDLIIAAKLGHEKAQSILTQKNVKY